MLDLREDPGPYVTTASRCCSRCGETKPIDEFPVKNKKTGLRRVWCRECCRAYGREHYRRNKPVYLAKNHRRSKRLRDEGRQNLIEYLRSHPCIDCGETDLALLDLDHRDRSLKRGVVSRLVHTDGWEAALKEIAKCDVRCANCHRRRTAQQLNWRKTPSRGALNEAAIASLGPILTRPSATGTPVTEQLQIWWVGTTRRCSRCHEEKPLWEFALRDRKTGERHDYCRPCQAAYRRDHYRRNRDVYLTRAIAQTTRRREEQVRLLHAYLVEHPCVDCGESRIEVLEFDHIDPGTKVRDVSRMLGHHRWSVVLEEIAKCDVVCANCHRHRTAERQQWLKRLGEAVAPWAPLQSGRLAGVL